MLDSFSSPAYGRLQFTPGLPSGFKGPFLAGSQPYHFSGEAGSIVVQEITGDQFTLQLFFFHFLKKIKLIGSLQKGLNSFFGHAGESRHLFAKQRIRLRKGQFFPCKSKDEAQWEVEIAKDKPLQLLKTSFDAGMMTELTPSFPTMNDLVQPETKSTLAGPFSADEEIREAVHKMVYAAYEPYKLPYYFKAKVSEYVFLLVHKASGAEPDDNLAPANWETSAVFNIRDLILSNILQHHTIPALAKRFKISAPRLKVFFKREFGVGPFGFLLNARLDRVKELMEEGRPMKEAAPLAGYQTTSFITAFKRRFGYPPGAIFRKKKD